MSKTYSTTIEITEEKEYSVTINTGFNLSAWIAAGNTTDHPLNPSSYANFAALEADEKAIRQLMLVHNAVDYLATAKAGDSLMQSVINSNVCAKWINLSDYALDTLSAKSNIKSVMDTADKYGYGEWGKINSTTWGALGNVPIMTANNAPYGVVIASRSLSGYDAYRAFDGSGSWAPDNGVALTTDYVGYNFTNPICPKKATIRRSATIHTQQSFIIEASNDNSTWTSISNTISFSSNESSKNVLLDTNSFYLYLRLRHLSTSGSYFTSIVSLQFYGRELKPLVPTMTSNTTPKGQAFSDSVYSNYPAYYAFNGNINNAWISNKTASAGAYVGYKFVKPTYVSKVLLTIYNYITRFKIQGSNDNSTWVDLADKSVSFSIKSSMIFDLNSHDESYLYYRLYIVSGSSGSGNVGNVYQFQFYNDYSEKEFAQGSTRKTIYDHGVAPSGAITGGTKNPDCLTLSAVGTATVTMDKGTRKYMGGKAGLHASGTNRLKCGSGYSAFTASNMPDSNGLDISSISGSVAVGIEQTASGTFDCTEIWLE